MNAGVFVNNAIAALLLPPLNLILVCALGLMLIRRRPRLGYGLSAASLIVLTVLATPAGSLLLVTPLENRTAPLNAADAARAQAIVVLGGGRLADAPEYAGQDIPTYTSLARLRYAATLHRATGLPILVTGGAPDGAMESEAALMARVLREEFKVPVQWLEERSHNTAQNAMFSAAMLRQAGMLRVLLVTDAMHMPRSHAIFAETGLDVIPAATMFLHRDRLTPLHYLPGSEGVRRTHYAMHEWIGLLWYGLRHGSAVHALPAS